MGRKLGSVKSTEETPSILDFEEPLKAHGSIP